MESFYFQLEKCHIPESVGHFLKGLDLVICALQWASRKPIEIVVGKDASAIGRLLRPPYLSHSKGEGQVSHCTLQLSSVP